MSKFSDRLKLLRKQSNLSQQELADQLGFTKSRLNMYERGEREPGFEPMETIADYFNVDLDYLMGRSDIPNRAGALISAAGTSPPEQVCTTAPAERTMLGLFRELNDEGQERAINYTDDLVSSGKYIKTPAAGLLQEA